MEVQVQSEHQDVCGMNQFGELKTSTDGYPMVKGDWGYAILHDGRIWIPAIMAPNEAKKIITYLTDLWKTDKVVFSAVLIPEKIKAHFQNVVREWDEWFEECQDYSHCIEIIWKSSDRTCIG